MAEPLPAHRAREYETIFIVHPDTPSDTMDQIAERITDVVKRLNGKLLKAENWGKRRLAYSVKKQQSGHYIYVRYLGYSDMVHEVERNLRMIEPVIKHITVKIEEDVNPDSRTVTEADISFAPQVEEETETVPDEEADEDDDRYEDDDDFSADDDDADGDDAEGPISDKNADE
jgi:small subunit ribosomal protein S6